MNRISFVDWVLMSKNDSKTLIIWNDKLILGIVYS